LLMSQKVRLPFALVLAAVLLYGAWGPVQLPVTADTTWGTTRYIQTRSAVGDGIYPPQVDLFGHTVLAHREERDEHTGATVVRERTLNHFALALSLCATGVAAMFVRWGMSGVGGRKLTKGRKAGPSPGERTEGGSERRSQRLT
jgi:hypothetical protein